MAGQRRPGQVLASPENYWFGQGSHAEQDPITGLVVVDRSSDSLKQNDFPPDMVGITMTRRPYRTVLVVTDPNVALLVRRTAPFQSRQRHREVRCY
jgi:hypothetical protein